MSAENSAFKGCSVGVGFKLLFAAATVLTHATALMSFVVAAPTLTGMEFAGAVWVNSALQPTNATAAAMRITASIFLFIRR